MPALPRKGAMNTKSVNITGLTNTLIFCTLLVLKLTVVPGMSWWIVFMPFWAPLILGMALLVIAAVIKNEKS